MGREPRTVELKGLLKRKDCGTTFEPVQIARWMQSGGYDTLLDNDKRSPIEWIELSDLDISLWEFGPAGYGC